jgi:hypothetical protein
MAKTCLNELTSFSSALLLKGEVIIYDTTRQEILRRYPVPTTTSTNTAIGSTTTPPSNSTPKNVTWEYVGNQDNQIHGPFTTEQMLALTKSGYFVGEQRVKIRYTHHQQQQLKSPEEEVSTKEDLLADLMDDDDDDDGNTIEPITKKTKTTNAMVVVKGDWMWSSEVNYQKYL